MKLYYMIAILVVIQASILLFDVGLGGGGYTLDPYNSSSEFNNTDNTVWEFVTNPTGWESTNFLLILASLVTVGGAIGIGVYLVTKSDLALLFSVFTVLLGFGSIPIISLYNLMNRNVAFFGCVETPCPIGIFFWTITGGLLGLAYVLSCIEWWTGRATS